MANKDLEKANKGTIKKGTARSIPKRRSKPRSVYGYDKAKIDRLVWHEIRQRLLEEFEQTKKTPKLVAKALRCVKNEKAKRLLSEYVDSLESGYLKPKDLLAKIFN